MHQECDLCGKLFSGRRFQRRDFLNNTFCSISCVEAFEVRSGLPTGRIYESRPGWSCFPVVQTPRVMLPC